MSQQESINIRPESGILAILSYLNYKPWFALAEFVDNAIQSHLSERRRLQAVDGNKPLVVRIKLDSAANRITISDNAGGIAWKDFPRAFKAAQLPPDRTGLSEFGLGMKTAACWFARKWTVRTTVLGEPVERSVCVDVEEIRRTDTETLTVFSSSTGSNRHGTEIILEGLYQGVPTKKTLWKVRNHLKDIYRCYTRDGVLELWLDEDKLEFEDRAVLVAPRFGRDLKPVDEVPLEWTKEIDVQFGGGCRARGFAAILETASTAKAGFSLFRRRRLIMGSDDEAYRPHNISGGPNDYQYQRLFGELHVEGVQVSHTKDGFRWGDFEDEFLQKLREQIDAEPLPLIKQANNFRKLPRRGTDDEASLKKAADEAAKKVEDAVHGSSSELSGQVEGTQPQPEEQETLPPVETVISGRSFEVVVSGKQWHIRLEFDNDPTNTTFVEVADQTTGAGDRRLSYRVGLAHPFVQAFLGANLENLEMLSFVAAAIALAEKTAQLGGPDNQAAQMRANIGDVLRSMAQSRS